MIPVTQATLKILMSSRKSCPVDLSVTEPHPTIMQVPQSWGGCGLQQCTRLTRSSVCETGTVSHWNSSLSLFTITIWWWCFLNVLKYLSHLVCARWSVSVVKNGLDCVPEEVTRLQPGATAWQPFSFLEVAATQRICSSFDRLAFIVASCFRSCEVEIMPARKGLSQTSTQARNETLF